MVRSCHQAKWFLAFSIRWTQSINVSLWSICTKTNKYIDAEFHRFNKLLLTKLCNMPEVLSKFGKSTNNWESIQKMFILSLFPSGNLIQISRSKIKCVKYNYYIHFIKQIQLSYPISTLFVLTFHTSTLFVLTVLTSIFFSCYLFILLYTLRVNFSYFYILFVLTFLTSTLFVLTCPTSFLFVLS